MFRITGVIFSDMGQAASFMGLDWVREGMKERLGFAPFPATLNVRPRAAKDMLLWEAVQSSSAGVPLAPAGEHYCAARLYVVSLEGITERRPRHVKGAIVIPEVPGYPKDKIEVVAPVRLKDEFGWRDGDQISLEFVN